jgi:hypothetical protein
MGGSRSSGAGDGGGPKVVATKTGPMRIHPKRRKNILDKIPAFKVVGKFADTHNMRRRKKFVSKLSAEQKSKLTSLDDDWLITPDGKSELDKLGYTREPGNVGNNRNGERKSINSEVQPKTASQMDNTGVKSNMITADKTSPTTAEVSEDQNMIDINRKGRKVTKLTEDVKEEPKLSKKVLLGIY